MGKLKIKGVFPPMVTPFAENDDVDYNAFVHNIDKWNETGLSGYLVLGSNSEACFLNEAEKLELIRLTVQNAAKGKHIMVGTGMDSIRETIALTNKAAALGAGSALILTPSFFSTSMNSTALIDYFTQVADHADIPVVTTYMAKGAIPSEHPLYAGMPGIQCGNPIGNKTFLESDVVLAIGNRFTDRHTGAIDVYKGDRKFIHINVEQNEIGKIFTPDLGIAADAKAALEQLLQAAKALGNQRGAARVADIPNQRTAMKRKTDHNSTPINPHRVFGELNKAFDADTMFTTGCGITQIWSGQMQEIDKPRKYFPSGGAGCLGWDIPGAIGAMAAVKSQDKCVCVMGDFGFTFHAQELATAATNQIPLIVCIVNNAYLGLIRQNQKFAYEYEYGVAMPENQGEVDYVMVAKGFNCDAERVFKPEDIAGAFERAKASKKPYVIDIVCEPQAHCSMGNDIAHIREFNAE